MVKIKRFLSGVLCILMIASLLPTSVFAEELDIEEVLDAVPTESVTEDYDAIPEELAVEVEEDVHEHCYEAVVMEPTCTEQGYTTFICECGDSYVDDYVDALEHNYTTVVTEPSCTEQGYTTFTCECGDSYISEYVDSLNHPETEVIPEILATCTEAGVSAGVRCLICGEIIEGCEEIPANGHVPDDVAEIPATTESNGMTAGTKCIVCGETLSGCEEILILEETQELETELLAEQNQGAKEEQDPKEEPIQAAEREEELELEERTGISLEQELASDQDEPENPEPELEKLEVTKVQVIFIFASEDAVLTVYSKDEQDEKTEYKPEPDGSYLLIPGVYYYTIKAEDYETIEETELTVTDSDEPIKIVNNKAGKRIEEIGEQNTSEQAMNAAITSGNFGDNLSWKLDDEGILTISGTGMIPDCTPAHWVTLPWNNSEISDRIKRINIEDGVTGIGAYAFFGCGNVEDISISSTVTHIGGGLIATDKLTTIDIPEGVKRIESQAFLACYNINSISIPKSIEYIGVNAFPGHKEVNYSFSGDIREWISIGYEKDKYSTVYCTGFFAGEEIAFLESGCTDKNVLWYLADNGEMTIYSDEVIVRDYKAPWTNESVKELVIYGNNVSIGENAFNYRDNFSRVVIGSGITRIGKHAFSSCGSLKVVEIEGDITTIGANAFSDDSELRQISLPIKLRILEGYAFYKCSSLESIILPNSLESLGNRAFEGCFSLVNVSIPGALKSIGDGVFVDCSSLTNVSIPGELKSIGNGVFRGCSSLANVTIDNGVSVIPYNTFNNCFNLSSIRIPLSISVIEYCAFENCNSLDTIYYGGSPDDWRGIDKDSYKNDAIISAKIVYDKTNRPVISQLTGTDNGVQIIWETVEGAINYGVFRKTADSSWERIGETSDIKYTDGTAKHNIKYNYGIRCISGDGSKNTSELSLSKSITYVAPPTISSVKNTKTGVTVKWTKAVGVNKVQIYRRVKTSNGWSKWSKIDTSSGKIYTDTTVKSGKQYQYRLRSLDENEKILNRDYSATKGVKHVSVAKISTVANTRKGVTIKWTKVAGTSRYSIWRKETGGSWIQLAITSKAAYTDKTATSGVKYSYRIRPMDKNGNYLNTYSATKSITFLAVPAITSIKAAKGKIAVTWAQSGTATKYRVYRKGPSDTDWVKLRDTKKDTFTDKTAVAGVKYSYAIKAYNSNAKVWSALSSAKGRIAK